MATKFSLINGTTLLIPDIKYLLKFCNGNLGIADSIKMTTITNSLSQIKSEEDLNLFKSSMGFNFDGDPSSYLKNGHYNFKASDITLNGSNNLSGLSAIERSLIQSIFESQKPYMDVIMNTTGILVKIEDIIARVLAIPGNPSLKPAVNPKALGYNPRSGSILNQSLSQLSSLMSIQRGSSASRSLSSHGSSVNQSVTQYETESIEYSTGSFDPNVEYTYEYINVYDDNINQSDLGNSGVDVVTNPDNLNMPKVVVFAVYDSQGNPLSDSEIPSWIKNSGKWFGQFDMISDFKYTWVKPHKSDIVSFSSPGQGWSIKKNVDGSPLITLNTSDELTYFNSYYKSVVSSQLSQTTLAQSQQSSVLNQVLGYINVPQQIGNLVNYGFLPTIQVDNGPIKIPLIPFKPKQVIFGTSSIWIDPEDDYDMKVIKVTPTNKIVFYTPDGKPMSATIVPPLHKESGDLLPSKVQVLNKYNKLQYINNNQITNNQLSVNTPYSSGVYGSCDVGTTQHIDTIVRYQTSYTDTQDYYIVEGILSSLNTQTLISSSGGSTVNSYYRFPKGLISAFGAFIRMITDVFVKLVPSISIIEQIISNPATFIVNDVILSKLGDNQGTENVKFEFFSKRFLQDFSKLASMVPSDRKDFVKNSVLNNYVFVDEAGGYKFLLDGSALVKFFSITFGIDIKNLIPKLTFQFDNTNTSKTLDELVRGSQLSNLTTVSSNLNMSSEPEVTTYSNGVTVTQETSIQYSTGTFSSNIDYTYIYQTQYINQLEIEGDQLVQSNDPDSQQLAISKYQQALLIDPTNQELKDKINKLQDINNGSQSIVNFLLNLVTFPFKIVKNIIDYIINFFKSLSNPFDLPGKIQEFISFKWLTSFFDPNTLLSFLGINFDIKQFNNWISNINNYADDHLFDLSKIISIPFMPSLFSVNKIQLQHLTKTPINMLNSILGLIQALINAIIDFIWALLGLKSIIEPPYVNFIKDTNSASNMNIDDIMSLLNGGYKDTSSSGSGSTQSQSTAYDFVYDIKLPDGTNLRDLNYQQLEKWISENQFFQFDFQY